MKIYEITAHTTNGEFVKLITANSANEALDLADFPVTETLIYVHAKESNYTATAGVDY
jgi:hypothetical protein